MLTLNKEACQYTLIADHASVLTNMLHKTVLRQNHIVSAAKYQAHWGRIHVVFDHFKNPKSNNTIWRKFDEGTTISWISLWFNRGPTVHIKIWKQTNDQKVLNTVRNVVQARTLHTVNTLLYNNCYFCIISVFLSFNLVRAQIC